mmetsp:Transcript_23419/g.42228  ORF Transcript_23419/g.42228 Transcript_23419/m.42228 type:complete len:103 (+) Transcript_23419:104-412(+)
MVGNLLAARGEMGFRHYPEVPEETVKPWCGRNPVEATPSPKMLLCNGQGCPKAGTCHGDPLPLDGGLQSNSAIERLAEYCPLYLPASLTFPSAYTSTWKAPW